MKKYIWYNIFSKFLLSTEVLLTAPHLLRPGYLWLLVIGELRSSLSCSNRQVVYSSVVDYVKDRRVFHSMQTRGRVTRTCIRDIMRWSAGTCCACPVMFPRLFWCYPGLWRWGTASSPGQFALSEWAEEALNRARFVLGAFSWSDVIAEIAQDDGERGWLRNTKIWSLVTPYWSRDQCTKCDQCERVVT